MESDSYRLLVVTGETSGEQHTARLLDALHELRPELRLEARGTGGRLLQERGVELLSDVRNLAAIGPLAAISKLSGYWRTFKELVRVSAEWRPHAALLVDFPEFNLRLARRLAGLKIPVLYFISPQLWAWRERRVETIRRYVDRMIVILPFEEDFYRERGVKAHFVGHPAVSLRTRRKPDSPPSERPLIGVLPGSRQAEIDKMLELMLETCRKIRESIAARFRLLIAPDLDFREMDRRIRELLDSNFRELDLEICQGPIEELLPDCDYAIIKSGTSTLQAMLLEVPFAMVYRMSPLSYWTLKPFVRVRMYCLANWIAGEPIVEEFVQSRARPELIARHAVRLLEDPKKWMRLKQNLKNASEKLGSNNGYRQAAGYLIDLFEDG